MLLALGGSFKGLVKTERKKRFCKGHSPRQRVDPGLGQSNTGFSSPLRDFRELFLSVAL